MPWNDHIELLALKQLNGEASPSDQAELQQWLAAGPGHARQYAEWEKIWRQSGDALQEGAFDTVKAWQKLDAGLKASARAQRDRIHRTPPPVIGQQRRRKLFLAAAVFIFILTPSIWWFYQFKIHSMRHLLWAEKTDRRIALPDGSFVYLRQGSSLAFDPSFDREDRIVELKGEAFFEVAPGTHRPFTVKTRTGLIEDLGTSFQVREEKEWSEVVVVSGKVKFTDRDRPSNSIILPAGQKALLQSNGFNRGTISDSNFMAWKTGVLEFKATPLDQAASYIQDIYHVTVTFSPELTPHAATIRITARFEKQDLKEVLEEIRLTTGLRTRMNKDSSLTIYGP